MNPGEKLCQCGCGQPTGFVGKTNAARGLVKGEPKRFLPGHHRKIGPDYLVDAETGCWVWQRAPNAYGYGELMLGGRRYRAHRYYYEKFVGPIPEGLQLDHLCRNRACVNPDHLEPVTNAENSHRGLRSKLTPDQVQEILASDEPAPALARRFGVGKRAIHRVRRGESYFPEPPSSHYEEGR